MSPALFPSVSPIHTLHFNHIPRVNEDTLSSPSPDHEHRLHTLRARPFTNLTVWAYFAFAFICLAFMVIFSYMIYSCYHSSKGIDESQIVGHRENSNEAKELAENNDAMRNLKRSPSMQRNKMASIKEKVRLRAAQVGKTFLEMKGVGSSHHCRQKSESERNIMSLPNGSQTSLANTVESAVDSDNHYLTSPALAHMSVKASHVPFHLPPPPPSPTPAYKEHIERQYRGRTRLSPVSPSPSFSPSLLPPPITSHVRQAIISEGFQYNPEVNCDQRANPEERLPDDDAPGQSENAPHPTFDTHNIRFVPPLNPFMTPSTSTVMLWNDPKLSPIHGSIITGNALPSPPVGDTSESSFTIAMNAILRTPTPSPKKIKYPFALHLQGH